MSADPQILIEVRRDATAPPGDLVGALASLLLQRARLVVAGRRADGSLFDSGAQNRNEFVRVLTTERGK